MRQVKRSPVNQKTKKKSEDVDVDLIIRKAGVDIKYKPGLEKVISKGIDPQTLEFNLRFELSLWNPTDDEIKKLMNAFIS